MKKTLVISVSLLLFSLAAVYPCGDGNAEINVEGTLKIAGNSWYLVTKDQEFLINFKSADLEKAEITLQHGEEIKIHGTLINNEITPCKILYKNKLYFFPENHDEECNEKNHGWGIKGRGHRGW